MRPIATIMMDRGIDDSAIISLAEESDYQIQCLESRIVDLESRLHAFKVFVARSLNKGGMCAVCGALPEEQCDAGLHG